MLLSLVIITFFVAGFAMEKFNAFSYIPMIKEKNAQLNYRFFQKILDDLVEKIPDLVKEKYLHIFFDFLGRRRPSSYLDIPFRWHVDVALDHVTTAQFECKSFGTLKDCRLKLVNDEEFNGEVQLQIYDQDRLNIYVQCLYVADYKPFISGKLILNLVKKMADSHPDAIATLDDASNVKILSLMITGKSYYEYMGFHYVHKDGTRKYGERKNYQKVNVKTTPLLICISRKLNQRMWMSSESFLVDKHLKEEILEVLEAEIGSENRKLENFWKIYRNVMKRVDFHALQKKFGFDEDLQRHAKTHCFTRVLRDCLQEQMKVGRLEFSIYDIMSYP